MHGESDLVKAFRAGSVRTDAEGINGDQELRGYQRQNAYGTQVSVRGPLL